MCQFVFYIKSLVFEIFQIIMWQLIQEIFFIKAVDLPVDVDFFKLPVD